jgi:hypothetical protein
LKGLPTIRFLFAYNNTNLFCRARLSCTLNAAGKKLSGGEGNYDGLDQFLFVALRSLRAVCAAEGRMSIGVDVQDCENVQNFFVDLRAAFLRAGRFFCAEKMCRFARHVHPIAVC